MADAYIRLAEPPQWCIQYPTCSACEVDLEIEDSWWCPSCGASWDRHAGDGDVGELPDGLTGPVIPNDAAWRFANSGMSPAERDERVREWLNGESR